MFFHNGKQFWNKEIREGGKKEDVRVRRKTKKVSNKKGNIVHSLCQHIGHCGVVACCLILSPQCLQIWWPQQVNWCGSSTICRHRGHMTSSGGGLTNWYL